MRVAQRIQQQWNSAPGNISLNDQKVKFGKSEPVSMKDRVAQSKSAWKSGVKAYQQASKEWPPNMK